MSSDPQPSGRSSAAPLAKPFLDALDRMQHRESLRSEELERRARALLEERFGLAQEQSAVGFAPGCLGLLSEHTHFFDGLALLMPLPSGAAVALRRASGGESRLAVEGVAGTTRLEAGSMVPAGPAGQAACLLSALLTAYGTGAGALEVALVTTVSDQRPDAYLSAVGVAFGQARALLNPDGAPASAPRAVAEAVASCSERPFSLAYPLAVTDRPGDRFILLDVGTGERLVLEETTQDTLGWGLVQTGCGLLQDPAFFRDRKERADEALARLQRAGFEELTSFRQLEHRDLHRALAVLPDPLVPLVRYLVSENRRVQKLVAAVRRRDWQLLGAVLLMSHAAKRNDLGAECPEADHAVAQVEAGSTEGLYGATLTGWGGMVVVAGQPFMVPKALDRIQDDLRTQFGHEVEAMLI